MADLDAGATGTMPSALIPDALRPVVRRYRAGQRDAAVAHLRALLPLINYENRQCGLRATKALMKEGGDHRQRGGAPSRRQPLHPATRAGLVELARRLDPLILRWGK